MRLLKKKKKLMTTIPNTIETSIAKISLDR